MRQRATASRDSASSLLLADLARLAEDWVLQGEVDQLTDRTIEARRETVERLTWFLHYREYESCGKRELRDFLAYAGRAHENDGGRWGNPRCTKPLRPASVHKFFRNLHALFAWLEEQEEIEQSPLKGEPAPKLTNDQVQPLTLEQVGAMIAAARKSASPARNIALVRFLVDTGARASEVAALKVGDIDWTERRCRVMGKGEKRRTLPFGRATHRALFQYLSRDDRENRSRSLFTADRSWAAGEGLTLSGIEQIIERLGQAAGIEGVRCSPHTLRHTFAIEFLRAGGKVFTLKELLGHTTLAMVNRYVALAQADIEREHRQFSPGDRIVVRR